ncbi:sugar transferase [Clostridium tertium]|uniref:Putative sugar transferase EpsL n=1 Tax=Clostridium tertium TaxID=1559 RepID=A0A6N2ZK26_9CLOT
MLYSIIKRLMDRVGAFIGIIILSPLLIIVAILIKIDSKGSTIFSQVRVGYKGREFKIYKFRTMVEDAEELKKDPRITKIGKFIRKTSIDELPQLLNILRGDMSIVGPRPSLPGEVKNFDTWMLKRLEVKPGLTCYWQVSGRNNIEFDDWMKLDIKYVEERNLFIDTKLILKTTLLLLGDKNAF